MQNKQTESNKAKALFGFSRRRTKVRRVAKFACSVSGLRIFNIPIKEKRQSVMLCLNAFKLLLLCVNANLFAISAHAFKLNNAVNKCEQSII